MRGFVSLACLVILGSTAAVAFQPPAGPSGEQPPPAGRPEGRGPGGRDQASVEGSMKGINRAVRQLRRDIGDAAKREENLRAINDAQRGVVGAKGQPLPEDYLKSAKDENAKTALRDEYRRDLVSALRKLVDLEQAVLDNKPEEAKKLVEEMVALRDDSHKKLGVDEE